MKKAYHSYKVEDDTIENAIRTSVSAMVKVKQARERYETSVIELEEAKKENDEALNKVIYLMRTKHCKSIVVDRVEYTLVETPTSTKLSKKLLLDS